MEQKQEYDNQFKIILLGDNFVGKSCMLQSFLGEPLHYEYYDSFGVDYRVKFFQTFNKIIKLSIWDSSGTPKVQSIAETYFRHVDGAFICFDVTNMKSFQNTKGFIDRLRTIKKDAIIFLIGCKVDLSEKRIVDEASAREFAAELGMVYLETSALKKINVEQVFMQILQKMYLSAQLKKYKPMLEFYFNEYLKLHSQKSSSGLFTAFAENITKEHTLKEEFKNNFEKLFDSTSMEEVFEFCRKTLHIIERIDKLYKHENPFWCTFTKSPLTKTLKQILEVLYEIFGLSNLGEWIQHDKTSAALASFRPNS